MARGFAQDSTIVKAAIAIVPCKTTEGVTVTEGSYISERITLEIIKQGLYTVLDKYEIQKKLRFIGEFRDTCSDFSCYFALGSACQASLVLWGTLSHKQTATTLELHVGSVSQSRVLNTVSSSIAGSTLEVSDQLPSLLAELFNRAVAGTAPGGAQSAAPAKTVYTSREPARLRTLSVRSEPAGARVTLNGEEIGTTPCGKEGLHEGIYDIVLDLYGYKKFFSQIVIKPDVDKKVFAKLQPAFGSLTVFSSPEGALCTLTGGPAGPTPFSCDTLRPGTYSIGLSLDRYAPVKKTLELAAGDRDTVVQPLLSLKYLDSLKQAHRKKTQKTRQYLFGAASLCCLGFGLSAEYSAHKSMEKQQSAYTAYTGMNGDKTLAQFDAQYAAYQNYKTETDKNLSRRNTWYGVGLIFLTALSISFRF